MTINYHSTVAYAIWENNVQKRYCVTANRRLDNVGSGPRPTVPETGTLKTRDWKTRDRQSMESLTKLKRRYYVKRINQKRRRPAFLWGLRERGGTSGRCMSHLPHGHPNDPASFLTFSCDVKLTSLTLALPILCMIYLYAVCYLTILFAHSYTANNTWNKPRLVHCEA